MGSVSDNVCVFDPRGAQYIGLPPTVLPLILKKYHHGLSWMYFCGYFILSNDSNWEFIYIIPIFEVSVGQNLGIWPPGVPIYRVIPHCFTIIYEEIPSCFVLNVFELLFCIINGTNCDIIPIIPIFGSFYVKILVFDPLGVNFAVKGSWKINFDHISE